MLLAVSPTRIVAFRNELASELADPGRAFGLFTFLAATDVLGTRLAVDAHYSPAFALLTIAWLALGYIVPWTAVLQTPLRPALQRANGSWFVWVVASQSVAVLAAMH